MYFGLKVKDVELGCRRFGAVWMLWEFWRS